MRINTNVSALNSQRILGQTGAAVSKNIAKLSSGFRINKAADDAAGLGIANKLRAETRALKQASRNAEQANSMLQIMEGSASKVGEIVERMKELSTQGASDNVSTEDRTKIIDELTQLREEIDRIVDTTKFQGSHLLKTESRTVAATGNGDMVTKAATLVAGTDITDEAAAFTFGSGVQSGTYSLENFGDTLRLTRNDGAFQDVDTAAVGGVGGAVAFSDFDITLNLTATYDGAGAAGVKFTGAETFTLAVTTGTGGDRDFLVSSSADYDGQDLVTLSAVNMDTVSLGLTTMTSELTSKRTTSTGADFQSWLTALDTAVDNVNEGLGAIGAAQNRIDFATQNVKASIENFAAAESTIRDVDMAAEMTEFSKNQILQQAGVSMLAQANSSTQSILKLLG